MTADILERLRNCDCIPHCLCKEAADEIEQLRIRKLQLERAISASEFLLRQTQEMTYGSR